MARLSARAFAFASLLAASGSSQQATFEWLPLTGGALNHSIVDASSDGNCAVGEMLFLSGALIGPYRWTASGGSELLATTIDPTVVSDSCAILGGTDDTLTPGTQNGVVWSAATGPVAVGQLPGGTTWSSLRDMTLDGGIVVGGASATAGTRAYRQVLTGPPLDLGVVGDPTALGSEATVVNDDGSVVFGRNGATTFPDPFGGPPQYEYDAFRWTAGGGLQLLGSGAHGNPTPSDCDADGDTMVYFDQSPSIWSRAYRWTAEHGVEEVPNTIFPTWPGNRLHAVSGDGSLAGGTIHDDKLSFATIWTQADGLRRLFVVLQEQGVSVPGSLDVVTSISDDGRVLLGYGSGAAAGPGPHAWRVEWLWPWYDVGGGLSGADGVPTLGGSGTMLPGTPCELDVRHLRAGAPTLLVVGFSALELPLLGGTLVPFPDVVQPAGAADAEGALRIPFTWPASASSGLEAWFQVWAFDDQAPLGLSASNGLRGTTP